MILLGVVLHEALERHIQFCATFQKIKLNHTHGPNHMPAALAQ